MRPLDPTEVNWEKVKADIEFAANDFHKSTGFDVAACQGAGWDGVARALRTYDADNEAGAKFSTYYNYAIKTQLWRDFQTLGTVVKRTACKKSHCIRNESEDVLAYIPVPDHNADNGFNAEEYPDLALLLATLSELEREIVIAHFYGNETFVVIAARHNVSKQRIHQRLTTALAKMRKESAHWLTKAHGE